MTVRDCLQICPSCLPLTFRWQSTKFDDLNFIQVLKILRRGLELQPLLMKAARDSPEAGFLTGLDKLLLGVNPRTGKADYILTVAKFVPFFGSLPGHTVQAIKLITVIATPANQMSLLAQVNVTDAAARFIVKARAFIFGHMGYFH